MSDWSDNLVCERREQEEKARINNELLLSNRRKIEQNAESQWQAIRKRIYELADEINASWGAKVVSVVSVTSHECNILVHDRCVVISFIARDHQLSVPFCGAKLELKVNGRDKLMWQSEAESSRWLSDDDVARGTIEYAWRGRNI
jgi:hypothetical protein